MIVTSYTLPRLNSMEPNSMQGGDWLRPDGDGEDRRDGRCRDAIHRVRTHDRDANECARTHDRLTHDRDANDRNVSERDRTYSRDAFYRIQTSIRIHCKHTD